MRKIIIKVQGVGESNEVDAVATIHSITCEAMRLNCFNLKDVKVEMEIENVDKTHKMYQYG